LTGFTTVGFPVDLVVAETFGADGYYDASGTDPDKPADTA